MLICFVVWLFLKYAPWPSRSSEVLRREAPGSPWLVTTRAASPGRPATPWTLSVHTAETIFADRYLMWVSTPGTHCEGQKCEIYCFINKKSLWTNKFFFLMPGPDYWLHLLLQPHRGSSRRPTTRRETSLPTAPTGALAITTTSNKKEVRLL